MARRKVVVKCLKFHFGHRGRLNRLNYFLTLLILYIIVFVIGYGFVIIETHTTIGFPLVILLFVTIWLTLTSMAKRVHDLNWSSKWMWILIGLSGFAFFPYLFITLFIEGSIGRNAFGDSPTDYPISKVLLGQVEDDIPDPII